MDGCVDGCVDALFVAVIFAAGAVFVQQTKTTELYTQQSERARRDRRQHKMKTPNKWDMSEIFQINFCECVFAITL